MSTPVSSVVSVLTAGFIGSFGAALVKSGSMRLQLNIGAIVTNWRLAAGVAAYLLSSVFFVRGMAVGELSVLYPMVALGYMWAILWSRLFFNEPFTMGKLVGLALIFAGLAFLGLGGQG